MMKLEVDDIEVGYKEVGSGKPLVLVMGFTGTSESWAPTVTGPLSARSRLIMPDNRGTGGTGEGARPFTIEQFAEDTAGFMRALGLENADILGWSMGGFIALELASRYPDLVDKLVLVSSYCGGGESIPIEPAIMSRLADMSGSSRDIITRHIELLFPAKWRGDNAAVVEQLLSVPEVFPPLEVVEKQAAAISGWIGPWSRLTQMKCQALLLSGLEDIVISPENSVMLAGRLPGCWLVQLERCGHGALFQEPEKCVRVIEEFLF